MPLNSSMLAELIKSHVESATSHAMRPESAVVWTAVAEAIIEHILANALVTVTVATTGSASAQTGTGVGKVT